MNEPETTKKSIKSGHKICNFRSIINGFYAKMTNSKCSCPFSNKRLIAPKGNMPICCKWKNSRFRNLKKASMRKVKLLLCRGVYQSEFFEDQDRSQLKCHLSQTQ